MDSIEQKVSVIKRFKLLLTEQRDRFKSYLDLLEKQNASIESGNTDALLNYLDIEEKIVADIFSIQKVIDPLENMYNAAVESEEAEVLSLKDSLERLHSEATERSAKNRELLADKMTAIRAEIQSLRNNPYAGKVKQAAYSDSTSASLIDIKG